MGNIPPGGFVAAVEHVALQLFKEMRKSGTPHFSQGPGLHEIHQGVT
jgi:hypothetical protein